MTTEAEIPNPSEVMQVMLQAVRRAGVLAKQMRLDSRKNPEEFAKIKEDGTIVTNADPAAEELILSILRPLGGKVVGEEGGKQELGDDSGKGYVWHIDPIDGTKNYAAGLTDWGVSIALEKDGEVIAGVVYMPDSNKLYWAEKDGPAVMQDVVYNQSFILKQPEAPSHQAMACMEPIRGMEVSGELDVALREALTAEMDRRGSRATTRAIGCSVATLCGMAEANQYAGIVATAQAPTNSYDVAAAAFIYERSGGKTFTHHIPGTEKLFHMAAHPSLMPELLNAFDRVTQKPEVVQSVLPKIEGKPYPRSGEIVSGEGELAINNFVEDGGFTYRVASGLKGTPTLVPGYKIDDREPGTLQAIGLGIEYCHRFERFCEFGIYVSRTPEERATIKERFDKEGDPDKKRALGALYTGSSVRGVMDDLQLAKRLYESGVGAQDESLKEKARDIVKKTSEEMFISFPTISEYVKIRTGDNPHLDKMDMQDVMAEMLSEIGKGGIWELRHNPAIEQHIFKNRADKVAQAIGAISEISDAMQRLILRQPETVKNKLEPMSTLIQALGEAAIARVGVRGSDPVYDDVATDLVASIDRFVKKKGHILKEETIRPSKVVTVLNQLIDGLGVIEYVADLRMDLKDAREAFVSACKGTGTGTGSPRTP